MFVMLCRWSIAAILFARLAGAQAPDAIVRYNFDKGPAGWKATMTGSVATQQVEPGKFSLVYEYDVDAPTSAALGLERSMLGFRRIRFQVRSNHDVGLIAMLVERRPGVGKSTFLSIPADTWETVDLSFADFVQADNLVDPSVPLLYDSERGQGFALGDASRDPSLRALQASAYAGTGSTPAFHGKRRLEIRDVEWFMNMSATDAAPPRFADNFDRGFLQWLTIGNVAAAIDSNGPIKNAAVKLSPTVSGLAIGVLYRTINNFDLRGAAGFSFDAAADVNTAIVVNVEALDPSGKKVSYSGQPEMIMGSRTMQRLHVSLDKLTRTGVPPQPFDPSRIRSVAIVSMWTQPTKPENGCWIGNLVADTASVTRPQK
jgi:hypothetical protein